MTNDIQVIVKKPSHNDFVFIKDKYVKQAERTGRKLRIVTPTGERICSAKDWMKGAKMSNTEKLVDKHYNKLFDELLDLDSVGDDLFELLIEVKIGNDGKTIRRSWRDRERFLSDETTEERSKDEHI